MIVIAFVGSSSDGEIVVLRQGRRGRRGKGAPRVHQYRSMYRRPSLGDYEAAPHLISPLSNLLQNSEFRANSCIVTDPHGLSSSLGWPRLSDTSPRYWALQDQARTGGDLGWRTGSSIAGHGIAEAPLGQISERILEQHRRSVGVQRLDPYKKDATRYVFSDHETFPDYAKDSCLYTRPDNRFGIAKNRLESYTSALGNADSLSLYPPQRLPLFSLYQTHPNFHTHSEQFSRLEMHREAMLCQERLVGNARNAESEIAIHRSLIGLGELQRKPSLLSPSLSIYGKRSVYGEGSTFGERCGIQPDLRFSERLLRSCETRSDPNLSNGFTGLLNRSNQLQNSVQLSENARPSYCQFSSRDLYDTSSNLFPEYPHHQPDLFAEQMLRKSPRQVRSLGESRKGKRVKRKKIGASHAKQFSSTHTSERKQSTSTAPAQTLFSTESEKVLSLGGSESNKTGDTGSKQGWDFNIDVKSFPTWHSLEIGKATASEFVTEENKEPNTVQDIQMAACIASRKFFQSLQDDESSDGSVSDFEDLDDDIGYPVTNDSEPMADNSINREEKTYQFFAKLFKEDERICKFYEENRNCGTFDCLVCFGAGTGIRRKYADLVSLVQHAKTIIKTKRRFEHRGYFRAVSDLLGWLSSQSHPTSLAPRGCIPPMHQPSKVDADSKVQEVPA